MPTYDANTPGWMFAEHLRSVGYSLETAIADIIDNSIEADATEIHVDWRHKAPDKIDPENPKNVDFPGTYVCISDNGTSMTKDRLQEAFAYGANRENSDYQTALGAFGTGMKTASTAFCRRVTVTARRDTNRKIFYGRRLDLDLMAKKKKWLTEGLEGNELQENSKRRLQENPGVSVLWENLDLLLDYKDPWADSVRASIQNRFADVEKYVAMVFHRFMSRTCVVNKNRRKVKIFFNDKELLPWNPIWTHLRDGEPLHEKIDPPGKYGKLEEFLHVDGHRSEIPIMIQGYVLPVKREFEKAYRSNSEYDSNPSPGKRHAMSQGYYFYRADRIIKFGGWAGSRTMDEKTKSARVTVDFDSRADSSFGINIAKGEARIPNDVKEGTVAIVTKVLSEAKKREKKHRVAGGGKGPRPEIPGPKGPGPESPGPKGPGPEGPSPKGPGPKGPGPEEDTSIDKEDAIEILEEVVESLLGIEQLSKLQQKLKAKSKAAAKFFNWN